MFEPEPSPRNGLSKELPATVSARCCRAVVLSARTLGADRRGRVRRSARDEVVSEAIVVREWSVDLTLGRCCHGKILEDQRLATLLAA